MIALTQRLVERDEQIMALQDELDAYDRRHKELEEKIKRLSEDHERVGKLHEGLKTEIGQKYGIDDWNKVAYDDLSGRLTMIPEPTKE